MRSQMKFVQILAGCLLMIACQRDLSQWNYPPPDNSYRMETISLTKGDASYNVRAAFVTEEFFKGSRVQPMMGRHLLPEEFKSNHKQNEYKLSSTVLLSHDLWQQKFGGSPDSIGADLLLNGRPYTVVGIMPRGFDFPQGVELWLPDRDPISKNASF